MRKTLSKLPLLMPLLMALFMAACNPDKDYYYDATVKFEFSLPESVAKVADLTVVSDFNGSWDKQNVGSSFAKNYSSKVDENASGTIMMLYVVLSLKDNYKEIVSNMTESELESFYNGCQFSAELKSVLDNHDEVAKGEISVSDRYKGSPENSKATTEKVIETLEKNSNEATPLFILNINKEKAKWSSIYAWDVWGETFE